MQTHCKGQASLEALLSFAALLCAIAILCLSAQRMSAEFSKSVEMSGERAALSYEALLIDTAGELPDSLLDANLSGIPVPGGSALASKSDPTVREPVFHAISISQGGKFYVQKNPAEPV